MDLVRNCLNCEFCRYAAEMFNGIGVIHRRSHHVLVGLCRSSIVASLEHGMVHALRYSSYAPETSFPGFAD